MGIMCVVSMIMDHYYDRWQPLVSQPIVPIISSQEIEEFRRLLERAKEYDRRNNEPDCELPSKKKRIKNLADVLGVKIKFLD